MSEYFNSYARSVQTVAGLHVPASNSRERVRCPPVLGLTPSHNSSSGGGGVLASLGPPSRP